MSQRIEVGTVVIYTVNGQQSDIWGRLAYYTADGWAGIQGPSGRIDEVRADMLMIDPT